MWMAHRLLGFDGLAELVLGCRHGVEECDGVVAANILSIVIPSPPACHDREMATRLKKVEPTPHPHHPPTIHRKDCTMAEYELDDAVAARPDIPFSHALPVS
jgi:hypothetical protein